MRPTFDAIRRTDENNKEYWSSRDLCNAMGYSTTPIRDKIAISCM